MTEIQLPMVEPHTGTAYTKFNIIEGDMGVVAVAVSITLAPGGGICQDIRIVMGAVGTRSMRAQGAEKVVRGKKVTEKVLEEAGEVASGEAEPITDIHASEEYRRELVKVLVKRMGKAAFERAQAG